MTFSNGADTSADQWTLRNAVEGAQIFGGIGSGKTSGSGAMIAKKYLSLGFGGLILTVKTDEKDLWVKYCKETNRLDDLCIIEPGGSQSFDFLDYEYNRSGDGAGLTDNIVNVLKTVINASQMESMGRQNEAFWEDAMDMLLFNTIDLCTLAYQSIHIDHLYNIVHSLPKDLAEVEHPTKEARGSFTRFLNETKLAIGVRVEQRRKEVLKKDPYSIYELKADPEIILYKKAEQYFLYDFPGLSDRTRSVIEHMFLGLLFRLTREPVRSLLCSDNPNLSPDDCLKGKIILINLPVKLYDKVGRDAQILFKYIWQRAMERRTISANSTPVILWADEAQNFLHPHDMDYQATARSSKVCTVYLTQNLPNYFAHMGGQGSEYKVKSFLGTMGTKIFHANADMETNKYAADLIGTEVKWQANESMQITDKMSLSEGQSEHRDYIIQPENFTMMRTGGTLNNLIVDGRIHRQGLPWFSTGRNDRKISFKQT